MYFLCRLIGGLAQLARALAWQARGHRFESGILHITQKSHPSKRMAFCLKKNRKVPLGYFFPNKKYCDSSRLFYLQEGDTIGKAELIRYSPLINMGLQEFLTFEAFLFARKTGYKLNLVLFNINWFSLIATYPFQTIF